MSDIIHKVSAIPTLRQKTWPWYHASIGKKLTPEGRKIFEDCGVLPEDVEKHILSVRDEAWEVFPFPCVGEFWFIEFGITHLPQFREIVELLRRGEASVPAVGSTAAEGVPAGQADPVVEGILAAPGARRLLDLGTCVGQDLRALRAAGAPASALYGSDVFPAFEPIGHRLFLDGGSFGGRFFASDVFDGGASSPLARTAGHWDVVTVVMFLHQYDRALQKQAAARALRLLRPEPGAMLVGYQTGQTTASEQPLRPPFSSPGEEVTVFRQSDDSMRQMFEEILAEWAAEQPGTAADDADNAHWSTRWSVWCAYDELDRKALRMREVTEAGESTFYPGDEQRRVQFQVRRL